MLPGSGSRIVSSPSSDLMSVRILIDDLPAAARALRDFRVLAAGWLYATLETTARQRLNLTKAHVQWTWD
jgi:hypothetical protein